MRGMKIPPQYFALKNAGGLMQGGLCRGAYARGGAYLWDSKCIQGKGCLRVYLVSLRKRNYVHYGPH